VSKIEHILVTAGGTVEAIDGVRQISNTSTGSLAVCIYEALAAQLASKQNAPNGSNGYMVHYVVSERAIKPEVKAGLPIAFYPVTDVESVNAVLQKLMTGLNIRYIIHSMAVSDFTKGYLAKREALISELLAAVTKVLDKASPEDLRKTIGEVLEHPACALDTADKVDSKDELVLSLNRTPKLIEKFKTWRPEAFLVGFKLLKGVSEQELIIAAAGLAEKNGCDLVLANDMSGISKDIHEGLLLRGREVVGRYSTKKEIAEGIARYMLGDGE
jgi:phosphopantothenate--cysteine ligase